MGQLPEDGPANAAESAESGSADHPEAAAEIQGMIEAGSGLVHDLLRLLAVEGRLAGQSLALILMLAVLTALFVVTTWAFLAAALALWIVELGWLSLAGSLLALALVNAGLVLLAWIWIRYLSTNLGFPGLVRAAGDLLPGAAKRQGS